MDVEPHDAGLEKSGGVNRRAATLRDALICAGEHGEFPWVSVMVTCVACSATLRQYSGPPEPLPALAARGGSKIGIDH
jgi:hypothetical protein